MPRLKPGLTSGAKTTATADPYGMTNKKGNGNANTGILRFAQNDDAEKGEVLRTVAPNRMPGGCRRCRRRGRGPSPRLLCVEEMCQRSDEGWSSRCWSRTERICLRSGALCGHHLRLRMRAFFFLAVALTAPFFFFFFFPGWAAGLMVVMIFVAMGDPRPEQASQPGPALKPTGVPM
jgi:hypothetical protein